MKKNKIENSDLSYAEIREKLNDLLNLIEQGKIEMEQLEETLNEADGLIKLCFEKIGKAEKIAKKWLENTEEA